MVNGIYTAFDPVCNDHEVGGLENGQLALDVMKKLLLYDFIIHPYGKD